MSVTHKFIFNSIPICDCNISKSVVAPFCGPNIAQKGEQMQVSTYAIPAASQWNSGHPCNGRHYQHPIKDTCNGVLSLLNARRANSMCHDTREDSGILNNVCAEQSLRVKRLRRSINTLTANYVALLLSHCMTRQWVHNYRELVAMAVVPLLWVRHYHDVIAMVVAPLPWVHHCYEMVEMVVVPFL